MALSKPQLSTLMTRLDRRYASLLEEVRDALDKSAIAVACATNVALKIGALVSYDRRRAVRVLWALIATVAGGAAACFWSATS